MILGDQGGGTSKKGPKMGDVIYECSLEPPELRNDKTDLPDDETELSNDETEFSDDAQSRHI